MGTERSIGPFLNHVLDITGRPVLMADVNTMTMWPDKGSFDTTKYETEAGKNTMKYYRDAASSPACIGIHRCTMRDYYPWKPEIHRRGLLKADDSPYSLLIDATRRTNESVIEMVYSSGEHRP